MADTIPTLTDDEAIALRGYTIVVDSQDARLFALGVLGAHYDVTDLGRAALAAYDAEQRAKIDSVWADQITAALGSTADKCGRTPEEIAAHVRREHEAHTRSWQTRAKIRVEAMWEVDQAIRERLRLFWHNPAAQRHVDDVIRDLIAKEEA